MITVFLVDRVLGGAGYFVAIDAIFLYAILAATIIHGSVWSVLGPGKYALRLVATLAISSIVLAGIFLAAAIAFGRQGQSGYVLMVSGLAVLYGIPFLVGAQVPFWVLRLAFGWQLLQEGQDSVPISIKELLIVTVVFAMAFSAPTPAAMLESYYLFELDIVQKMRDGGPVPMVNVDGEFVEVTKANVERIRARQFEFVYQRTWSVTLTGGTAFLILSILVLPVIWNVMRSRNKIIYGVLYMVVVFLIAMAIFEYFGSGMPPDYVAIAVFVSYLFIALPLFTSKQRGFRLKSGRRNKGQE